MAESIDVVNQYCVVVVGLKGPDATITYCISLCMLLRYAHTRTHTHRDHAGGNEVLKAAFPSITVYGGKLDKPSATT